ncbi:MAG: flagellar basal body rod protein FlgC [Alphaproteobacteria bacterium]
MANTIHITPRMSASTTLGGGKQSPLKTAQQFATGSIRNDSFRIRLIAENLANANSTSRTNPYQRKVGVYKSERTKDGHKIPTINKVARDKSPPKIEFRPGHPDADESGYVMLPNINVVTETVDMLSAHKGREDAVRAASLMRDSQNELIKLLRM